MGPSSLGPRSSGPRVPGPVFIVSRGFTTGQKVDVPLLSSQCFADRLSQLQLHVSSAPEASWVVMHAMNNHTMESVTTHLQSTVSKLFRSYPMQKVKGLKLYHSETEIIYLLSHSNTACALLCN